MALHKPSERGVGWYKVQVQQARAEVGRQMQLRRDALADLQAERLLRQQAEAAARRAEGEKDALERAAVDALTEACLLRDAAKRLAAALEKYEGPQDGPWASPPCSPPRRRKSRSRSRSRSRCGRRSRSRDRGRRRPAERERDRPWRGARRRQRDGDDEDMLQAARREQQCAPAAPPPPRGWHTGPAGGAPSGAAGPVELRRLAEQLEQFHITNRAAERAEGAAAPAPRALQRAASPRQWHCGAAPPRPPPRSFGELLSLMQARGGRGGTDQLR
eukprot:TRINITY_DN16982_c1_g1_i1.p1 TRINITY_DN16982_c1_g1~~TRINITY_DN16982_c1_g1_i1.p1  ORF type:complete len:302 (+),score=95.09 TRINITY_DN16982_c1_g1_i1:85-906(+)